MIINSKFTEIDNLTGEVLSSKDSFYKRSKVEEPRFVKMFIDDIAALQKLSLPATKVMYVILKEMNYNNMINLLLETKKDISKETEMTVRHIEKSIMELKNKNILITRGRASYVVNPKLFGKGDWNNINGVKMTIVYDDNGRMIDIVKDIKKQEPIVKPVDIINVKRVNPETVDFSDSFQVTKIYEPVKSTPQIPQQILDNQARLKTLELSKEVKPIPKSTPVQNNLFSFTKTEIDYSVNEEIDYNQ